jgi:hypothetical protein
MVLGMADVSVVASKVDGVILVVTRRIPARRNNRGDQAITFRSLPGIRFGFYSKKRRETGL